jgi:hypothetical protein
MISTLSAWLYNVPIASLPSAGYTGGAGVAATGSVVSDFTSDLHDVLTVIRHTLISMRRRAFFIVI